MPKKFESFIHQKGKTLDQRKEGKTLITKLQSEFHPLEKKMASKEDSLDKEKCLDLFLKIGLDERTAKNTIANNKVTTNLTSINHEAGVTDGCSRTVGNLLYTVATKCPANVLPHQPTLLQYVVSSKVKTMAQLDAALSFLATTDSENLDLNKFEEACGVGVEVSTEDIQHAVNEVFDENKAPILELRYRTNVGELLGHVRKRLPWADANAVKQMADAKLYELLGDRAADDEKPSKIKEEKHAKVENLKGNCSGMLSDLEVTLKPFYQRASEAEDRLSRLEAGNEEQLEEQLKLIEDLGSKLIATDEELISEKQKAVELAAENTKRQYRINCLCRSDNKLERKLEKGVVPQELQVALEKQKLITRLSSLEALIAQELPRARAREG